MRSQDDRRRRFEQLAGEVFEPLQRYLRRRLPASDVEDVFADVLLTLWRRIDAIPGERPLPWCYGVARRTLANHRRTNRRHLALVGRLSAQPQSFPAPDPTDLDGDPALASALATLPPPDREILYLWAWEELEPREIALVLESTPNAVSLRLSRARHKLADAMNRQDAATPGHRGSNSTEEQR
jgi:RNA polymerase sigma-70 factor, ECF subfamily